MSSPEGEYSLGQGGGRWGKVNPNIHIFYPHISIYEVRVSLPKNGCISCGTVIYIYIHI